MTYQTVNLQDIYNILAELISEQQNQTRQMEQMNQYLYEISMDLKMVRDL